MSVLRNEQPFTTADIANPQPTDTGNSVINETDIDPADRLPPRSATGGKRYTDGVHDKGADDTYDGEIVKSSPGPAVPNPTIGNVDRWPVSEQFSASPASQGDPAPQSSDASAASQSAAPLFHEDELRDFRARWDQVQASFVDEPRHAVEQADTLVATVVKRIAEQFAEERGKLEKQWHRGDSVSTEDLRQGFKRYRAFFDRLLSF